MRKKLVLLLFLFVYNGIVFSQDTFSIVAVDSETGEVGSAGASCVDLSNFPGLADHFLGELFPGVGAINTQAWYQQTNQANARIRMNAGDSPEEIIDWLVHNDVTNQPQLRQYGIAAIVNGSPQTAGHTGSSTDDFKNHVLGPNYAIQGNILLGQEILDSMESRFLNTEGDLACKLMAAMQGANVVGADSRCAPNGTSSLFAFIKVVQAEDTFGNPSFVQSVRTPDGSEIEPIDSLQILFDQAKNCNLTSIDNSSLSPNKISILPNPASGVVTIDSEYDDHFILEIRGISGEKIIQIPFQNSQKLDISYLQKGMYFVKLQNDSRILVSKLIVLN